MGSAYTDESADLAWLDQAQLAWSINSSTTELDIASTKPSSTSQDNDVGSDRGRDRASIPYNDAATTSVSSHQLSTFPLPATSNDPQLSTFDHVANPHSPFTSLDVGRHDTSQLSAPPLVRRRSRQTHSKYQCRYPACLQIFDTQKARYACEDSHDLLGRCPHCVPDWWMSTRDDNLRRHIGNMHPGRPVSATFTDFRPRDSFLNCSAPRKQAESPSEGAGWNGLDFQQYSTLRREAEVTNLVPVAPRGSQGGILSADQLPLHGAVVKPADQPRSLEISQPAFHPSFVIDHRKFFSHGHVGNASGGSQIVLSPAVDVAITQVMTQMLLGCPARDAVARNYKDSVQRYLANASRPTPSIVVTPPGPPSRTMAIWAHHPEPPYNGDYSAGGSYTPCDMLPTHTSDQGLVSETGGGFRQDTPSGPLLAGAVENADIDHPPHHIDFDMAAAGSYEGQYTLGDTDLMIDRSGGGEGLNTLDLDDEAVWLGY